MPEQRPPIRAHPAKPFQTWRDAEHQRLIVTIRCGLCRKVEHYLPEDLARVFGPNHPSHIPPFSCARCRTVEYLRVTLRLPSAEEYLTLHVRRPVRPVQRWIWKTVKFGQR